MEIKQALLDIFSSLENSKETHFRQMVFSGKSSYLLKFFFAESYLCFVQIQGNLTSAWW